MSQLVGKFIIIGIATILYIWVIISTLTYGVDFRSWVREKTHSVLPLREPSTPADTTGVLKTNQASLFEDHINVYLGSNLSRHAVQNEGSRQILKAFSGLEIVLEDGQLKVSVTALGSDGKVACEITDNEWEVNSNPGWKKNFDKSALEVIDDNGLPVLQVELIDEQTLKIDGLLLVGNNALCATNIFYLKVPRFEVQEHIVRIASVLETQERIFLYPADTHFGERADRQQIKLRGRDERLSTKNVAIIREGLARLTNTELKGRLKDMIEAMQKSISQALEDAPPEPNNPFEEWKEIDEYMLSMRNTTDPKAALKLQKMIEELPSVQRNRAGIQEYETHFKPELLALYEEIASRLGTSATQMPRRIRFEAPPSHSFLIEALNELKAFAEKLE